MTIQTIINDGYETTKVIWRKVYNKPKFITGFIYQASMNKWGELWQLKGKEHILLAKFGVKNEK